jgi:hypothetical protein
VLLCASAASAATAAAPITLLNFVLGTSFLPDISGFDGFDNQMAGVTPAYANKLADLFKHQHEYPLTPKSKINKRSVCIDYLLVWVGVLVWVWVWVCVCVCVCVYVCE